MIFDLFIHAGAAAFAGGELFKEAKQRKRDRAMSAFSKKFQKMYTDPELEAELKAKIENPDCYDWVWERLEAYKRNRGKYYLWRRSHPSWKAVGHSREDFFYGRSLYGKNQRETERLRHNRGCALWMLMQTYGRMTQHDAKWLMLQSTYNDMCHYQHKHPADLYLNDTWTALSEAPLELVDMPDGWPEDHRPPNEVPE